MTNDEINIALHEELFQYNQKLVIRNYIRDREGVKWVKDEIAALGLKDQFAANLVLRLGADITSLLYASNRDICLAALDTIRGG